MKKYYYKVQKVLHQIAVPTETNSNIFYPLHICPTTTYHESVGGSVVGGSVGRWVGGSVGRWVGGSVGRWVGGSVGRWVGGSVGRWVGGSVGRWVGGSVGRWIVNPNNSNVQLTPTITLRNGDFFHIKAGPYVDGTPRYRRYFCNSAAPNVVDVRAPVAVHRQ